MGRARTSRVDPANPGDAVWRTFDHRPRFGNNYVGLRNRLAILSEAYSYLDFRGRVRVTEVFCRGSCCRRSPRTRSRLTTLLSQLDGEMVASGKAPARGAAAANAEPAMGVEFEIAALPQPVDILVGEVEKKPNPRSGREMLAMTSKAVPVQDEGLRHFQPTSHGRDAARLADPEGAC